MARTEVVTDQADFNIDPEKGKNFIIEELPARIHAIVKMYYEQEWRRMAGIWAEYGEIPLSYILSPGDNYRNGDSVIITRYQLDIEGKQVDIFQLRPTDLPQKGQPITRSK